MADSKPAAFTGSVAPSFVVDTERVRPNTKLPLAGVLVTLFLPAPRDRQ